MTSPSAPLYPEESNSQARLTKICTYPTCPSEGEPQPIDNFDKRSRSADKRMSWCKTCHSTRYFERKVENIENLRLKPNGWEEGETKICTHDICHARGIAQPLTDFYRDSSSPDGRDSWCKQCSKASAAEWEKNNIERKRERQREWQKENAEHKKQYEKEYRQKNAATIREKNYAYEHANWDHVKERKRLYAEAHKEHLRELNTEWRRAHWEFTATNRCRTRAKKKGVPFDMKPSDLLPLPEFCPLFPHIRLDYNAGPDMRFWPSVDRKVPELGYTSGNVWVVSMIANTCKSNGSNPEERRIIVSLTDKKQKRKDAAGNDQPSLFDGL